MYADTPWPTFSYLWRTTILWMTEDWLLFAINLSKTGAPLLGNILDNLPLTVRFINTRSINTEDPFSM